MRTRRRSVGHVMRDVGGRLMRYLMRHPMRQLVQRSLFLEHHVDAQGGRDDGVAHGVGR